MQARGSDKCIPRQQNTRHGKRIYLISMQERCSNNVMSVARTHKRSNILFMNVWELYYTKVMNFLLHSFPFSCIFIFKYFFMTTYFTRKICPKCWGILVCHPSFVETTWARQENWIFDRKVARSCVRNILNQSKKLFCNTLSLQKK